MRHRKANPTRLCKSLWAIACLSPALVAAQADWPDQPPPNRDLPRWAAHNRHLSISATQLHQRYREQDTQGLTTDGTLNSERGNAPGTTLQGRWQGDLSLVTHSLPLWLQASTTWVQGQTQYDGYLQSGSTLTPYRAKTGNTWRSHSVALGAAIAVDKRHASPVVRLFPHWQRPPQLLQPCSVGACQSVIGARSALRLLGAVGVAALALARKRLLEVKHTQP